MRTNPPSVPTIRAAGAAIQQSQSNEMRTNRTRVDRVPRRRRRRRRKKSIKNVYARTGNAPISTETHRLRRINLAEFCSTLKSSNRGSSNGAFLRDSSAVAFAAAASDARRCLDLRVLAARDADGDDGPPRTRIDGIANLQPRRRRASASDGSAPCVRVGVFSARRDVDETPRRRRGDAE